ncbi:MAG: hypothetical protein Q7T11_04015 [Deltaproteobacteria bacterium]|nr:hypothetical protein [Deltaproteobacteria bacterium]
MRTRFYLLLAALIGVGCGEIPDQGGTSEGPGVSAPLILPTTGNLNPDENEGDLPPEAPLAAPEFEAPASADTTSPALEPGTGPIATAPDPLGGGPLKLCGTGEVELEASGGYLQALGSLVLHGTVLDNEISPGIGCRVIVWQDPDSILMTIQADSDGSFRELINDNRVNQVQADDGSLTATLFLQAITEGKNLPIGEVATVVITIHDGPALPNLPSKAPSNAKKESTTLSKKNKPAPTTSIITTIGTNPVPDNKTKPKIKNTLQIQ